MDYPFDLGRYLRPGGARSLQSGLANLQIQFTANQSDDPDGDTLLFAWDFGDERSASIVADPSHTYTVNGIYQVSLTVDDQQTESNSSDTAPPLRIVMGNRSPSPTIVAPAVGSFYNAGDVLAFSGTADDPGDGPLGAASFSWTIVFHHDTHTHPFLGPIEGVAAANFTIPTSGENSTNVFYRIYLTVTDSGSSIGELSATTFVDVQPNIAQVTLAANPPGGGLELEFDQARGLAPVVEDSVVNFARTIGAPSQTVGDDTCAFDSWSDAGAAEHIIATPATNTTFTATFHCSHRQLHDETIVNAVTVEGCDSFTAGTNYTVSGSGDVRFRVSDTLALANGFTLTTGGRMMVERVP